MNDQEFDRLVAALDRRLRRNNRRSLAASVVLVGLVIPATMLADTISVPHSFVPNTVAKAAEVNENFALLSAEATRISNIIDGPGDGTDTNRVMNLAAPLAGSDAANKDYVDAASDGGGPSVTLIGATSCPAGWSIALSGTAFFVDYSSTSSHFEYACFGSDVKLNGTHLGGLLANNTAYQIQWEQNVAVANGSAAKCVICVK